MIRRFIVSPSFSCSPSPSKLFLLLPRSAASRSASSSSSPSTSSFEHAAALLTTTGCSDLLLQQIAEEKFALKKSLREYRHRLATHNKKEIAAVAAWSQAREIVRASSSPGAPPPTFDRVLSAFFFDVPAKWYTKQDWFWILRHLHPTRFADFDRFHKDRIRPLYDRSNLLLPLSSSSSSSSKGNQDQKKRVAGKLSSIGVVGSEQEDAIELLDEKKILCGKNFNLFSPKEVREIIDGMDIDSNDGRIVFRLWSTLSSISEFNNQQVVSYLKSEKLVCVKRTYRCYTGGAHFNDSYRFVPATNEQFERVWAPRAIFKGSLRSFQHKIKNAYGNRRHINDFSFRSGGFKLLEEQFPFTDFRFATGLTFKRHSDTEKNTHQGKKNLLSETELQLLSQTPEAKKQIRLTKYLIGSVFRGGSY